MNVVLIVLGSVSSSALVAAFVSFYLQRFLQVRTLKLNTYRKLLAFSFGEKENVEALNEVQAVFADSRDVLAALDKLYDSITNNSSKQTKDSYFIDLIKKIRKDIGISALERADNRFFNRFSAAKAALQNMNDDGKANQP